MRGVLAFVLVLGATQAAAQDQIDRSKDRGEGLPLSMFGTYIKSGEWIVYPFFESEDELEFITEAQISLTPRIVLKLNNALGVTSKATDWAPEVGVMFSFR